MREPATLPDLVPRRGRRVLPRVGSSLLSLAGWHIDGVFPNMEKFVVIAAPHTSNWDFVIGLAAAFYLDIDAHWIGKHTIFRWPFGSLMRRVGGIPVDRSTTAGMVSRVAERIRASDKFVLAIAPEGTRKAVEKWRSGFYQVALQAGVPIVCCYFDYPSRTVGIGQVFQPTGDYERDAIELKAYYARFRGKRHSD